MKFHRNICISRDNVRFARRDETRVRLQESTPAFSGTGLWRLAGEAPAP